MKFRSLLAAAISVSLACAGLAQTPPPPARGPQATPTPPAVEEANRLYRRGELEAAMADIIEYLAKDPKDVRARFLRGLILADQKRSDEALAVFTELAEEHPELPEPHNNLAVLYAARGQYERAREALLLALRSNPDDAVARENLGDVYVRLAAQSYEQALAKDGKNRGARNKLSVLRELSTTNPRAPSSNRAEDPSAANAAKQGAEPTTNQGEQK